MCEHDVILLRDEDRAIYCTSCRRTFGHLGKDPNETLIVPLSADNFVVVVEPAEESAVGFSIMSDGHMCWSGVYPCRACGWEFSCEDGCHS